MTKDELSLLLFFETAFVDHGGLLSSKQMNSDDHKIANRWTDEGYVQFERICAADITRGVNPKNHCVWLSDQAIKDAHLERRARARRCWKSRSQSRRTVSEYRTECNEAAKGSSKPGR